MYKRTCFRSASEWFGYRHQQRANQAIAPLRRSSSAAAVSISVLLPVLDLELDSEDKQKPKEKKQKARKWVQTININRKKRNKKHGSKGNLDAEEWGCTTPRPGSLLRIVDSWLGSPHHRPSSAALASDTGQGRQRAFRLKLRHFATRRPCPGPRCPACLPAAAGCGTCLPEERAAA
jgi:hypothetical protein